MKAPATKTEEYDQTYAMVMAVCERERQAEERWGIGRLQKLVPLDWVQRYVSAAAKFNRAVWGSSVADVEKFGAAMLRAYDKLDDLALAGGHDSGPPDQWEFEVDGELVILVRDRARVNQVNADGRRASVWSLDEIASVVRSQRLVVEAKAEFPGAVVVDQRPARRVKDKLDDALTGLPF